MVVKAIVVLFRIRDVLVDKKKKEKKFRAVHIIKFHLHPPLFFFFSIVQWHTHTHEQQKGGMSQLCIRRVPPVSPCEKLHRDASITIAKILHAVQDGKLSRLKLLIPKFQEKYLLNIPKLVNIAIQNNHLHVVIWLHGTCHANLHSSMISNAARYQRMEIVEWLLLHSNQHLLVSGQHCWEFIGTSTNTKLLDHAIFQATSQEADIILRQIVCRNHLPELQWLIREHGRTFDLAADESSIFCLAAGFGHLEMLRWMLTGSGHEVDLAAQDQKPLRDAFRNRHFHVVKWLAQVYQVDLLTHDCILWHLAWKDNDWDMMQWLVLNSEPNVTQHLISLMMPDQLVETVQKVRQQCDLDSIFS